jgi:flavin reductase (DIM6/NTAB) family NADH-FMN oxidoreductase RutF
MLVCVNRSAGFHDALNLANEFAINILSRAHVAISRQCGGGNRESRFSIGDWDMRASAPLLIDAQATIIGSKDKQVEYGTHTIFMGRIIAITMNGNVDPLLCRRRIYRPGC